MPDYPGAGKDLRFLPDADVAPIFPVGSHEGCRGSDSDILFVREVAMMIFMDKIMDKPDWHIKIHDDEIAEAYGRDALNWPVDDIYRECIRELRSKATYFAKTGIMPTLDATYTIAKSDTLVGQSLHEELQAAIARLKTEQGNKPDWHPNTNEIVQDLVHPSVCPFVYGRSRFLADEVVGVEDAIDKYAGKGEPVPKPEQLPEGGYRAGPPATFWSEEYQWLPSNMRFKEEGGVEFTSYINNLHPIKHLDTYRCIEKLVEKALPMWDQCLLRIHGDRRFGTGLFCPRYPTPSDPDASDAANWDIDVEREEGKAYLTQNAWRKWEDTREPVFPSINPYEAPDPYVYRPRKVDRLRTAFKDSGLQVIVKIASMELTPEKPEVAAGNWHVEGQQNEHIVATALYYVDEENISPSELSFRMFVDPEKTRQEFPVQPGAYQWLEMAFGTRLGGYISPGLQNYGSVQTKKGRLLAFPNVFQHRVSPFKLEDATKPGRRSFIALWLVDPMTRIISTANVPPQRADWFSESAFKRLTSAVNKTTHGKTSFPRELAEILVDRNIDNGEIGEAMTSLGDQKLPTEIVEMLAAYLGPEDLPMSDQEIQEHRLKIMEERSSFHEISNEQWDVTTYSFCEH